MNKEDCGCTVSQSRDGKSFCIGFCPLHSAAQEMLNALKAIAKDRGPFSNAELTFALIAIGAMKGLALAAIAKSEPKP